MRLREVKRSTWCAVGCVCNAALRRDSFAFRRRRRGPQGKSALAARAVGFGGTGRFDAGADGGEEAVHVAGEKLRVGERGAAARVNLHSAGVEAKQAEGADTLGQQAVRPSTDFAQEAAAWCWWCELRCAVDGMRGGTGTCGSSGGEATDANVAEHGCAFDQHFRECLRTTR